MRFALGLLIFFAGVTVFAAADVPMDLQGVRELAFARCQGEYQNPVIEPIAILDPPKAGGRESEGLTYQEELAIHAKNLLDQQGFYFQPRPRAALNNLGMDLFVSKTGPGIYLAKTWDDAQPDYSSNEITPPLDVAQIPEAGKVLTEVIIGHQSPAGDYPQLVNLRSSAYLRFAGYPPEVMGASLRLGAHNVFALVDAPNQGPYEDFPIIRALFLSLKNDQVAHAYAVVESRQFCTGMSLDFEIGPAVSITVDSHWYARRDFDWRKDPHTGYVAYSSMFWKSEVHTPERDSDEAHDSDTLRYVDAGGVWHKHSIDVPEVGVRYKDLGAVAHFKLANEDKDPANYADFAPALGHTNYNYRSSYAVEVLESTVPTGLMYYESKPIMEYADNIVALGSFRGDIARAQSADDSVRVLYRTRSY